MCTGCLKIHVQMDWLDLNEKFLCHFANNNVRFRRYSPFAVSKCHVVIRKDAAGISRSV